MRNAVCAAALVLLLATGAMAAEISGNYIEARTANVYVGACFANSEVGLLGREALLGWQVTNGSWDGVPLAGLSVVGVVRAQNTLGDPFHNPYPATSVLVVDQKATPEQARALVGFARSHAPELFARVLHVESAPIEFVVEEGHGANGGSHESHGQAAKLVVGDMARIVTRALQAHDKMCANDELYYPPLTDVTHAEASFAVTQEFKGDGLGTVWSLPNRASAFVGTFAR